MYKIQTFFLWYITTTAKCVFVHVMWVPLHGCLYWSLEGTNKLDYKHTFIILTIHVKISIFCLI